MTQQIGQLVIEWGSAGAGFEGGPSGDALAVVPFPNGTLVAVIDGLGHGPEAATAAQAAVEVLHEHPEQNVTAAIKRCHEELRRTRGAVLSLASFDASTSTVAWIGVGNVEGVLLRADPKAVPSRYAIATRGGVVGYKLPPLQDVVLNVFAGDTLIMVTDGIRSEFASGFEKYRTPQDNAEFILTQHGKKTDDALVLVARYVGREVS